MTVVKRSAQIVLLTIIVIGCKNKVDLKFKITKYSDYPIKPIDIRNVKLTDNFWLPIIKNVQEKTIEYAIQKCQEEGRFDNFLIAGKK